VAEIRQSSGRPCFKVHGSRLRLRLKVQAQAQGSRLKL